MKNKFLTALFAGVVELLALPVNATTIQEKSDRTMAQEADLIVVGRCTSTRSE